ncbi:lipopolysaccharide biosynthesis protein [Emticicia sp. TH156]|uniref:lipopolysaccharide biosynthesis protein n=1 Tax=Emticicia sp. TH156 TaxID=2067454 RepID=UPI00117FB8AF|nr:hypothetical protein [Emticicia sp. TH156]
MTNSAKIAKNTFFLYIRMCFTLGVGLYSSRISLNVLGFEDYGLYDLVTGVVMVFSFLQSSLMVTSTRFFNLALSENNNSHLKDVFGSALYLHRQFALLLFLASETLGIWFLNYRLNISDTKLLEANILFQFSTLSLMFLVTQIPYQSIILAREKMLAFAYISVLEALLKLLVPVALIWVGNIQYKVAIYGGLVFSVGVIIRLIYRNYCRNEFQETRTTAVGNKDIVKKMRTFFGWDLYKKFSEILLVQGVKVNLNLFYGVIINSSVAIANQAQGGIAAFVNNFTSAIRPQTTQSFVTKEFKKLNAIIDQGTRIGFFLLYVVCVPVIFNAEFVFSLWLGNVPGFAVEFFKLGICAVLISVITYPVLMTIEASEKMKWMSFTCGTLNIIGLIAGYYLLKAGYPETTPFIIKIIIEAVFFVFYVLYLKKVVYYQFQIRHFLLKVILRIATVVICSVTLLYWFNNAVLDAESFFRLILNFAICLFTTVLLGFRKAEINYGFNLIILKLRQKR